MNSISGLVLCALFIYVNCDLIQLQNGVINGTIGQSKNGRSFHQFYGIAYAKPPVKELRFKNPLPVESWTGIKDASQPPPMCLQAKQTLDQGRIITGQEDCLYLNVFVPSNLLAPSGKAPVMVGIHGGAFRKGTGLEYRPGYLMDRDVILVTINYRVGVLGFFGLNNDVLSGNFGLKDQSLALRWVHENIARFGGDPGNVILIGGSAGAASVHLHMFSPLSKGLFQKAIMQSGSGFGEWACYREGFGEAVGTAMVAVAGCLRNDPAITLKCLQRIPAEDFFALESKLHASSAVPELLFIPIVESKVKDQAFLTEKPTNATYLTRVPWITGINSGEGAMMVMASKPTKVDKKTILESINEYLYTTEPENIDTLFQKIIDHYFGAKEKSIKNTMLKFVDLYSDGKFLFPFVKTVQSGRRGEQYVYYYDHRGSYSLQEDLGKLSFDLGVCHGDEIPLLFRYENLEAKWTPQDRTVSETLLKFWTNFAISGDPNGHSGEEVWKPVETDDIEYLHIKSDSVLMSKKSFKERFDFWQSLLPLANK